MSDSKKSSVPLRRSAERGFESSLRSAEHGFESSLRSAEHGFESSLRSAEHGFTLIEMLVALAVFSLAALALLRLEGATLSSTHELDQRTIAQLVARNIAVDTLSDPTPPPLGRSSGEEVNAGRNWRWTREARRIGDGQVVRVDLSVLDESGQTLAGLTVVRPGA